MTFFIFFFTTCRRQDKAQQINTGSFMLESSRKDEKERLLRAKFEGN